MDHGGGGDPGGRVAIGDWAMRSLALVLALTLVTVPSGASARGGHHGLFGHGLFGGGGHHGHSINAWMGSRRPRLR